MNRFRLIAFALLCLGTAGCVEGEMTSFVNPDGSAKVRVEVVTNMPISLGSPDAKKDDDSIEALRRKALRAMLESPGISAWKDVSADFLPNGRLKFSGTAYVKKLEQFDLKNGAPLLAATHTAERGGDGSLKLVPKMKGGQNDLNPMGRKPKSQDELKKMTDAELDKYILRELIDIQSSKWLFTAMLSDAKLKVTYVLPGNITAATGFERDGQKAFYLIDGNKALASFNKTLNQDQAAWRKMFRETPNHDALQAQVLGLPMFNATVTVGKADKPLFDYDKEVKDARAAYPELRKKFGFGEDLRLPTDDGPPKK